MVALALSAYRPAIGQEITVTAIVAQPKLFGKAQVQTHGMSQTRSGRLTLQRGNVEVDSSIASDGVFLLPFVPPGRYRATIAVRESICTTTVDVPAVSAMRTNLGVIACSNPQPYG